MKKSLKKLAILLSVVVLGTIFAYSGIYARNGLTASPGDKMTSAKWNELVSKVSGVFTDGSGNVGIGITTPNSKLDVDGSIKLGDSNINTGAGIGDLGIRLKHSKQNLAEFYYYNNSTNPRLNITADNNGISLESNYTSSAGELRFGQSGTERMRISPAGNVGIGTSTPSHSLHVKGGGVPQIYAEGNTLNYGMIGIKGDGGNEWQLQSYNGNGSNFAISKNQNDPKFSIDNNGNVGIGTTTPSAKLEVNGTVKTDAYDYEDKISVMPNDMSYSAGGYSNGSAVTLDQGIYMVKFYSCMDQNSRTGGAYLNIFSNSGTVKTSTQSYVNSATNGGTCGYISTGIVKILSPTANVFMRVTGYSSGSNTDSNPGANSVSATFIKIL